SFISRSESCSQLSAEFVILLPIYLNHKVFVSSIKNSFVPFNHEAPSPLMRLGAFAIVTEERGFGGQLVGLCGKARRDEAGRKSTRTGKHDVGIDRQLRSRLKGPRGSAVSMPSVGRGRAQYSCAGCPSCAPRGGNVVSSLQCMNDPQPEGQMASHIG